MSRIAVILPIAYRGGSLRVAKIIAETLQEGARQDGKVIETVLAYPHLPDDMTNNEFLDSPNANQKRLFDWKRLDANAARRAMFYAGQRNWVPTEKYYYVPDDGIRHFYDCDLWMFISDRLPGPLLPLRPYILVVYDYLQRYFPEIMSLQQNQLCLKIGSHAKKIMVTTRFTEKDAIEFGGFPPEKVHCVPPLVPVFKQKKTHRQKKNYFIWTTNAAIHKNHHNMVMALKKYYEEHDGQLECHVTGVNSALLPNSQVPHLSPVVNAMQTNPILKKNLFFCGELTESEYQQKLAAAQFLLHPTIIDNGTFSVIEAAQLNVPSLSSDYPAMREIDSQFQLNLAWMNPKQPQQMAEKLKWMEVHAKQQGEGLPSHAIFAEHNKKKAVKAYWEVIQSCL